MIIPIIAIAIRLLWLGIEYPYLSRHRVKPAKNWDKHSALLWDVAQIFELTGIILGFTGVGRMKMNGSFIGLLGLALLLAGIAIRWTAIYTLGKYFTSVVTIKDDHRIIQSGLYKYLRHPAYTGALVGHLGLGLSFSNWFSLSLSFIPFLIAAVYRMRVEERALGDSFGEEYFEYMKRTDRLIPKIY